jgi:hypothetical protein
MGILPKAMYGVEHFAMSDKNINALRRQAAACGCVKPTGVLTAFRLLAQKNKNCPGFKARATLIARLAREVWMISGHKNNVHEDSLSGTELCKSAVLMNEHNWEQELPQGPLRVTKAALQWLNWKLIQTHILEYDLGNQLDLNRGSPAMLNHYMVRTSERRTQQYINNKLQQRCRCIKPDHVGSFDWTGIGQVLRGESYR